MDRRTKVVLVAIGVLLSVAAPVIANQLSGGKDVGENVVFEKQNGPNVTIGETQNFTTENPYKRAHRIVLQPYINATSDGDTELRLDRWGDERWTNVSNIELNGNELMLNASNKRAINISGGFTDFRYRSLNVSRNNKSVDLYYGSSTPSTIVIRNATLSEGEGVVAVDADTGEALDSNVTTADGRVILNELPDGTHNVRIRRGPGTMFIYYEGNPDQLVDESADITLRFFGSDGNTVVEREVSGGTADLTGVPADVVVTATISSDQFYDRRVVLESTLQQQDLFVLNKTANVSNITFALDDRVGEFPESETRLEIRKALNRSDGTSYYIISSDYFGASNEYPAIIESGARYQLRVVNQEGDTRTLGSYIPRTDDDNVELPIGQVTFDIGSDGGDYEWGTNYNRTTDASNLNHIIEFRYEDDEEETTDLELAIVERGNESNVLDHVTEDGPLGNFSYTRELTDSQENKSWVVIWNASRNGNTINGRRPLGDNIFALNWNLDPTWEKLLVGLLVVFVAGFFPEGLARIGSVVTASVAAFLWSLGILPIPVSWVLAALAVAVIGRMAQAGGLDSS